LNDDIKKTKKNQSQFVLIFKTRGLINKYRGMKYKKNKIQNKININKKNNGEI
jgi:hypothetical protein